MNVVSNSTLISTSDSLNIHSLSYFIQQGFQLVTNIKVASRDSISSMTGTHMNSGMGVSVGVGAGIVLGSSPYQNLTTPLATPLTTPLGTGGGTLMRRMMPSGGMVAEEPTEEHILSIGRIFQRLTLRGRKITVFGYFPRSVEAVIIWQSK